MSCHCCYCRFCCHHHHWQVAKTWIESNGGFVHPFLHFDSTKNRRLVFYSPSSNRHDDTSDDNDNSSTDALLLEAGTTLLKIPEICLLTLHSVERDDDDDYFGKSLFGVVHSLSSNKEEDDVGSISNHQGGLLYHDAQDVILALYLAYLREQLLLLEQQEQEDGWTQKNVRHGEKKVVASTTDTEPETELMTPPATTTTTTATTRPSSPWHFYEPYINILPIPLLLQSANNDVTPGASSSSSNNEKTHRPPPLLPRQWSITTIQNRLAGTSLYNRVLNEQNGIKTEYELVKKAWMNKQHTSSNIIPLLRPNNNYFPTFENYDTMMAMVSSRGFANLGYDGVDALVPILDLLNHCRGGGGGGGGGGHCDTIVHNNNNNNNNEEEEEEKVRQENGGSNHVTNQPGIDTDKVHSVLESSRVGPNVRYSRYYEDDNDSDLLESDNNIIEGQLSKRQKTTMSYDDFIRERRGGVHVITSRSIPPGSILQMTYGAKGNTTLLGRYGFCISNNVEPDGSCNDVLEIEIKANAPPVKLQRGPKSYAYGPFVHALELCYDLANGNHASRGDAVNADDDGDRRIGVDDGDLEDFLDLCDNECNDEDDTAIEDDNEDDESSEADDDFGENGTSHSRFNSMMSDIRAIDALSDILSKVKTGLVNNPLSKWMHRTNLTGHGNVLEDADRHCSILIHSEIQTVDFFLAVGSECRRRLVEHIHEISMFNELPKGLESVTEIESVFGDDFIVTGSMKEQIIAIGEAFLAIRYSDSIS